MKGKFIISSNKITTQYLLSHNFILLHSNNNISVFINNKDIILDEDKLQFVTYSDTLTF